MSHSTPVGGRILDVLLPRLCCLNVCVLRQLDVTFRDLPQMCASGCVRLNILLPGAFSLPITR
jgi:hypothetical protein